MKKYVAEFIGTLFLLMIVVGSGIMGENLSQGNAAIALFVNSIATGAGLFVLIQSLGPISSAHFNPIVSLVEALWGRLNKKELFGYWIAQFTGAVAGVFLTHLMFNETLFQISQRNRSEPHLWLSEFIATFGLISVISLAGKKHVEIIPFTIASYITSAYWFTSSSAFANPAVTVARIFTDTFCGITPTGVFSFVMAQIFGAFFAYRVLKSNTDRKPTNSI